MRQLQSIFVLLITIASAVAAEGKTVVCTDRGARALAHAYWLSSPFVAESLSDYVTENAALFQTNGEATRCARAAGQVLLKQADRLVIADELLWFSGVLPSLASGDSGPYEETGTETRQMVRRALRIVELCQVDPTACEAVAVIGKLFQDNSEQDVYILAMSSNHDGQ